MHKLLFYPIWKLEKAELFLDEMALKGFCLDRIYFRYLFLFKVSNARKSKYVLFYAFVKEYEIWTYAYNLRKTYGACPIRSFGDNSVVTYRITKEDADLSEFIEFRTSYIKRIMIHKIIFGSFMAMCFLVGTLWLPFALVITINIKNIIAYFYLLFHTPNRKS